MSANDTIRRVAAPYLAAIPAIASADDSLRLLRELCEALAASTADLVFLKLRTEAGWTAEEAQELKATVFHGHMQAIVDSVHAFGGTMEMADALVQAAAVAFAARLDDLAGRVTTGGAS